MIKNPNEIVDELVGDLSDAFGDRIMSVILYGSAVSHEFQPGKSLIETMVVLDSVSVKVIGLAVPVHKKWFRRGVISPRYYQISQLDRARIRVPVHILDMQRSYRVLFGSDPFDNMKLSKVALQMHCCRFFEESQHYLYDEYNRLHEQQVSSARFPAELLDRCIPFFRTLLVLFGRRIPNSTTELLGGIEDLFGIGSSVISETYLSTGNKKTNFDNVFERFDDTISIILDYLYRLQIVPDEVETVRI